MSKLFVSYIRVSTARQGSSGLGLEAQQTVVAQHVTAAGGNVIAEYAEVESGKRNDRPQLAAALAHCRVTKATLIVAKIDRLARNVAFVSRLMESKVEFVCCDMPTANSFTIHILAAVAEHEAKMISARTVAALAQAKLRGVKLGNPNLPAADSETAARARAALSSKAREHALMVAPYIDAARKAGAVTLRQLGEALTARGVATVSGGAWWPKTVANTIALAA